MKTSLRIVAAFSAVSLLGLAGARAEDPPPPTPPGGSVTPPASKSTTPRSSQQVPLSLNPAAPGDHGKHLEKLKLELGLTPEQVKKMRPILKTAHEQAKMVRENASLNEQQKHQKVREIFVAAFHQFKPILTPAQVAKLKQLRAEHHATTTTSA